MAEVNDVAAALLLRTGAVTTMKLQKLVYYAQAWHLVFHSRPLFSDAIEAWPQGPVTRTLYEKHRGRYQVKEWPGGDPGRLTKDERETISWVLAKYSHFSAETLSRMTHMETPWRIARGLLADDEKSAEPIKLENMRHFYSRQRADPDVAVSQAAASSAMEGVELDDAWQSTLRRVAGGSMSADDVIAEEVRRITRR
ncbi:MAG TPA: type II toxin-antitoxin system antitoxin SocA domain-containing protein [Amycolatopsis sp.]|uniref:Panacea domain-containing protein n=1 Tax=Amycolatopsis sp. TaxID=37632 RepID=UPI002B49C113|nr:type II toxin-antitoxin system antitoxin SocA domain-containing protein [Amycolatopsis sp.]HKS44817.1 type II toxin-antitoxin system antitoxin SocA domain-containing protein [Amycolatopsis sp.]